MTRRGLLGALLGAATMDPERLLWVPGAKMISIPKPVAVSGNRLLTSEEFIRRTLAILEKQLMLCTLEERAYRTSGFKIGDTVIVQKPARFRA